jgi:hypothetical protein
MVWGTGGGPDRQARVKVLLKFLLLTLFLPSLVDTAPAESIAIVHVMVIDGTGRNPQSDQSSTTAMFTKTVKEVKIGATNTEVTGLDPGDYFWNVTAIDGKKQTSEVSEIFKFTLVAQGKSQEMVLEIDSTQLHGRVAEIVGRTEPGAALIVNGQPVPNIAQDGSFRHFTEPLDPGQHTIVVIGQNRRGGTAKQQVSIVVPK